MEVGRELIDASSQEIPKIKTETELIDPLPTIKVESLGAELENHSTPVLNPSATVKIEPEDLDVEVPVDDINLVQASDLFVNTCDLVKIKEEVVKSELLNEECDLEVKTETKDHDLNEPCTSKQSQHAKKSTKKGSGKKPEAKRHLCPVCGKNLSQSTTRKTHLENHFRKTSVPCSSCGKLFVDCKLFLKHLYVHRTLKKTTKVGSNVKISHKEKGEFKNNGSRGKLVKIRKNDVKSQRKDDTKKFECKICSKHLKTRKTLGAHLRNHAMLVPECKICSERFQTRMQLNLHKLSHKGRKPLKCDVCSKEFLCKSFLDIHYRFHSGEKPFHCDICSKQFLVKSLLDHHMFVHKGIKPFKCAMCPKEFIHKPSFDRHVKRHTRPDYRSVEVPKETKNGLVIYETKLVPIATDKPYKCDACARSYFNKQSLKKHLRVHTGEKPFQCEICLKEFSLKPVLKQHMLVHTGEKPYTCDICSKKFSQKKNLTDHYRTHTGERPFKCTLCDKSFPYKKNLKQHVVGHTGEKPFECHVCSAKFGLNRYLKRHLKIHEKGQNGASFENGFQLV